MQMRSFLVAGRHIPQALQSCLGSTYWKAFDGYWVGTEQPSVTPISVRGGLATVMLCKK